jgi:hypothetical protein
MSRRPGDLNNLLPTGSECLALLACLAVAAPIYFVATHVLVTLAIVGFAALLALLAWAVYAHEQRSATALIARADTLARAHTQHQALMDGDTLTGTHGLYPPHPLTITPQEPLS